MKLVSYRHDGVAAFGRVEGDRIVPLGASLKAALASGLPAATTGAGIALDAVTLLPVLPDPAKIFCVGHNYEDHRRETDAPPVGHPSIFTRFADTLIADGAPIVRPRESERLDYEGELAVVIGRPGRRIAEADALAHIAGFTCANDASIRDWQRHTRQFTPGKNFPATAPLGPWLVTPHDLDDLDARTLTTRVNGAIVQQAAIGQMIFPITTVIAYISAFTPLSAGDVILTGTPGGVGDKRDPQLWLKPGDRVEVHIDGIGTLSNPVTAED